MEDKNKSGKSSDSAPRRQTHPRIVTMDSIRNSGQDSERQAYFAGGSETSGQQILGRGRRGDEDSEGPHGSSEALAAAFKRAAAGNDAGEPSSGVSLLPGPRSFGGVGHRLGDTETMEAEDSTLQTSGSENPAQIVLTLWENGYTLDNGPILSYNDPRCQELMANLDRGELPNELIPYYGRPGPVHLAVIDKRSQKYKESVKVFGGKGHKLGSPTPPLSDGQSESPTGGSPQESAHEGPSATEQSQSINPAGNDAFKSSLDSLGAMRKRRAKPLNFDEENDTLYEYDDNSSTGDDVVFVSSEEQYSDVVFHGEGHVLERPSSEQKVASNQSDPSNALIGDNFDMSDEGARTTTLKIRLPGGRSVQIIINASNTVQQLREYIRLCIPFLSEANFVLQLSYPKRDLRDDETCDSKDIYNSLLILRM